MGIDPQDRKHTREVHKMIRTGHLAKARREIGWHFATLVHPAKLVTELLAAEGEVIDAREAERLVLDMCSGRGLRPARRCA